MSYLKTVVLQGFKSFAHPTVVELSSGLNVIVGPNGAGKSNLLDALRFVLGERVQEGRGSRIAQVIFHGSSSCKPLGMASVETKWAKKEDDVWWSIERRVFVSGESEYLWNGEKVRLLDLKSKIRATGFSLERMSMGVVNGGSLGAVFDLSPAERLRWFEQMSGIAEIRMKLGILLSRLGKAKEREKRFAERLREVESQMERLKILAREEEEYLRVEQEVRSARKFYLCQMRSLKEEKMRNVSQERVKLEGELAELCAQITVLQEELMLERKELESLRSSLRKWQTEKEERERVKRKDEEELYHLLTRGRESVKLSFLYRMKLRALENEVERLESQVQDWHEKGKRWACSFRGERTQAVLLHFQKGKIQERAQIEEERIGLERGLVQRETALARIAEECRQDEKKRKRMEEEIQELSAECAKKEALLCALEGKKKTVVEEIQTLQERIRKKNVILQKISGKLAQIQEGHCAPEVEKLVQQFTHAGWSQRAVYALSWFLQGKGWYERETVELKKMAEDNLGRMVVPLSSSWSSCSMGEIQALLRQNVSLSSHLISSDGSCLLLQGGILIFPFKAVSSLRGSRFLKSLQERKKQFEMAVQSATQRLQNLERELQMMEKKHWEAQFELEHARKRIKQIQKEYQEVILEIEGKKKEEERIWEEKGELLKVLKGLRGKKAEVEQSLKRLELSLKKVQEMLVMKRKIESEREKLRWEVRVLRDKFAEVRGFFEEEKKTVLLLEKRLQALLPKFQEHQAFLFEKAVRLGEGKRSEYAQNMVIQKKEDRIRELERQREGLIQKIERLRLQEEKLSLERGILEQELGELEDVALGDHFSFWELKEVEDFVQERTAWLKSQKIRRGAIEELRDLQQHYHALQKQDQEILQIFHQVEDGCSCLEREGTRQFRGFLQEVKAAFERYFKKIFQGGEVYFLEEPHGIDIEVKIPGKKRQPLLLLSSGEKAITALCLLFAIFEAGRFPFCFLDEVDANLDHTNSTLFATVLSEFARSRQVIVVTHQEEVMEKAHRIVGVTMNEPGVSQIVSFEPARHSFSVS
ncbi:MAG: AAA family ATPase [Atribacterota bacterium]